MAELTNNQVAGKGRRVARAFAPRIDFTPMVDLMFLLITFFMLTTTLSKPAAMDLAMPEQGDGDFITIPDNRTMTICLGKDNLMEWYMGAAENPLTKPKLVGFGREGIRKVLTEKVKQVIAKTGDRSKGLIVLVKPSDKSMYQNVVDILDELNITKVHVYSLAVISRDEVDMLKRDGIY